MKPQLLPALLLLLGCGGSETTAEDGPGTAASTWEVGCGGFIGDSGWIYEGCGDVRACCDPADLDVCWFEDRDGATIYECVAASCTGLIDTEALMAQCGEIVPI